MPLVPIDNPNPIQQEREKTGQLAPTPGGRGRTLQESEWQTPGEQHARQNLEKILNKPTKKK